MKTLYSSGPLLFSMNTKEAPGKIRVQVIKIEEFEYDDDGDLDDKTFKIVDHNEPHFKKLSELIIQSKDI